MNRQGFTPSVNLSDTERIALLDQIDEAKKSKKMDNRRGSDRVEYRASDVGLTVTHPGGGVGNFVVCSRNLGTHGTSFLHGGFLHPSTACTITVTSRAGDDCSVDGLVVWCEHVSGRIHLIGVEFDSALDPRHFVEQRFWPKTVTGVSSAMEQLKGQVLFLDDQEMDRDLMKLHLGETGIKLEAASTSGQALDKIANNAIDIFICDLNLGEMSGVDAIESARKAGFRGPIILLTAESNQSMIEQARAAGATQVVQKPYDPLVLMQTLSEQLREMGANDSSESIFSDLGQHPGMAETLARYLENVQRALHDLQKAIKNDDFSGARTVCQTLKATGSGYGFGPLTEMAQKALVALDSSCSVAESTNELRRLESTARRLKIRDNAA